MDQEIARLKELTEKSREMCIRDSPEDGRCNW